MENYPGLAVTAISATDLVDVLTFTCGDEAWCSPVDEHFHERAFQEQMDGQSVTYVARTQEDKQLKALGTFAFGSARDSRRRRLRLAAKRVIVPRPRTVRESRPRFRLPRRRFRRGVGEARSSALALASLTCRKASTNPVRA